jgi:hypothetical protein
MDTSKSIAGDRVEHRAAKKCERYGDEEKIKHTNSSRANRLTAQSNT